SYPLEWLDLIITVTLNPAKTNVETISPEQAGGLCARMDKEVSHLKSLLKNRVFSLTKQRKIRLIIRHYHSTLILYFVHAIQNGKPSISIPDDLIAVHKQAVSALHELLLFIELRFATCLRMYKRVPVGYVAVTREEPGLKLAAVRK